MTMVMEVADALQTILNERADQLAQQTGFIKRQRKLTGSSFVKALVFGWLAEGEARLETLSQSAANVHVNITRQGLHYRFTPQAAAFLQAVLVESIAQVIAARSIEPPVLKQFEGVYVMDSTVIVLPDALRDIWRGCEGSALKVSVCWELLSGALVEVHLHDAAEHDQRAPMQTRSLPINALRLADLGYYKLDVLKQLDEDGVVWVTRYKGKTQLLDEQGQEIDLLSLLSNLDHEIVDESVYLGSTHRIGCRLIAQRVSDEQLEERQERLRRWESRKQKQASPLRWALLAWSIYVTNTTPDELSKQAVMVLARVRWQIELLFRLWKDSIDVDDWRSEHVWRILCEVYAKLIACLIQHWLLLVGGLHALERSMVRATSAIQNWAWPLAYALPNRLTLCRFIDHIGYILATSCRVNTSSSSPPTFQRLQELDYA